MLPISTAAIFLRAVLVFGVQPLAARILLPQFGGSPAVWNATSLSFQLPLLQRWFSYTHHPAEANPYFLYAASNAGSLLVLLAYQFLIESRLTIEQLSIASTAGYVVFALIAVACGVASRAWTDEYSDIILR